VHEEMMIWSGLGIDNFTILKSATVNPSLFFQEDQKWGTIELGKSANLIILGQNPLVEIRNITTVEKTIVKGKVFERSVLMSKI
jgi:imidazolonepropionase-like amidohydrolase